MLERVQREPRPRPEERWEGADDPEQLLGLLPDRCRQSERKWRLFAVACSRRLRHLDAPEEAGEADAVTDLAERHADGRATAEALAAAFYCRSGEGAWIVAEPGAEVAARDFARSGEDSPAWRRDKTALLRDLIGNPFREGRFDPAWRTATVISLATAAYEERLMPHLDLDPVRLSVLADALEDGGCAGEALLSHLRSAGPHVRGCWALDLCLGKR
jgi:hypothetical protein